MSRARWRWLAGAMVITLLYYAAVRLDFLLLMLHVLAGVAVVTALILAAGVAERSRVEAALRRSEEQLRLVVEAASSGMLMVGPNGTIVFANAQVERMFGYPREELLGQPIET